MLSVFLAEERSRGEKHAPQKKGSGVLCPGVRSRVLRSNVFRHILLVSWLYFLVLSVQQKVWHYFPFLISFSEICSSVEFHVGFEFWNPLSRIAPEVHQQAAVNPVVFHLLFQKGFDHLKCKCTVLVLLSVRVVECPPQLLYSCGKGMLFCPGVTLHFRSLQVHFHTAVKDKLTSRVSPVLKKLPYYYYQQQQQ